MRPAGLIPSFSLIRLRSPAPSTREGRGARAALPFLLGLRLAPQPYETTVDACLSPTRGLQPPLASLKTPGRVPRRVAPSAPPRSSALSTRITRGLFIRSFRLSSLSGGPARGFPVRSWSPLARDPRPSQLGPGVFPDLRRPAPWMQEYAGRTFCLENKLCASCVNELEIKRVCIAAARRGVPTVARGDGSVVRPLVTLPPRHSASLPGLPGMNCYPSARNRVQGHASNSEGPSLSNPWKEFRR